ncbi:MAG: lysylphosphatidylglycerol synthase transmembrane domain-containing protein [Gemmatimonadales bacterium]
MTNSPADSAPAVPTARKRPWQALLAVAISLAFLAWALHGVHFDDVLREMRNARILPLVATVFIATSTFVLRIPRWRLLLRNQDGSALPPAPLWHAIAIGFMANNVLPFRAGEVLRSLAVTRLTRTRITAALSSIAVERLFDGLAIVTLLTIGLLTSGLPASAEVKGVRLSHIALVAGLTFLAGMVVAGLVVAFPRVAEATIRKLVPFPRLAEKLVSLIEGVVHGLSVLQSPWRFLAVLGWSLAIWGVNIASFYVGFQAFGITVNFAGAMIMQGLLAFAIVAPSAPGFVGVFEGAIRATLALYAVGSDQAVTYALVYHATTFVPITLLGAWSLLRTGIGLRSLRQEAAR